MNPLGAIVGVSHSMLASSESFAEGAVMPDILAIAGFAMMLSRNWPIIVKFLIPLPTLNLEYMVPVLAT